ncbi:unnamed protein product [marine sediment metagenome]|uniref:GlcG protein n=1 Tax=marine sediment metagenome TaxID=412755 RepID=X0TK21_9ZZZZ
MIEQQTLGLAEAEKAVTAMTEEASKGGRPMSMAVVDAWGNLISFARMNGASPLTARMAINKAYTAASFGIDTRNVNQWFKDAGKDVAWYDDHRLTVIHGGVAIRTKEGTLVGAIGTSGRHEDEDEALALVGKKALEDDI